MADRSKIEWTDATWNPIRGCSRVSEGCRNCYAEHIAARFAGPGQPYEGVAFPNGGRAVDVKLELLVQGGKSQGWTGDVRFIPELLEQPLHWRAPRRIFVNSMSDLFHEKVQKDWLDQIFAAMIVCPQHTFQILTKRPEQMKTYLCSVAAQDVEKHMARLRPGYGRLDWPWRNVWLGVSVEDQKTADERIPLLLETPAAVRWVSYEPALGEINFRCIKETCPDHDNYFDAIGGIRSIRPCIDWVVAGGESGPSARPAHPDWFRQARDQCQAAHVPFFFKQWGEWLHVTQMNHVFSDSELDRLTFKTICRDTGKGDLYFRVGKKRAGALLDGTPWREFPAFAKATAGTPQTDGTMP